MQKISARIRFPKKPKGKEAEKNYDGHRRDLPVSDPRVIDDLRDQDRDENQVVVI